MRIGKPIQLKDIDPGKNASDRAQQIVDAIMANIAKIEKPTINEL